MPETVVWEIEPHTLAKHKLIAKYLNEWFPRLGQTFPTALYIDGFAGPGRYSNGEPGSPLIALTTAINHRAAPRFKHIHMSFIEADESRAANLVQELKAIPLPPNITYEVNCGEFSDVVSERLAGLGHRRVRMAPAFVLVDPFGIKGIPLSILRDLLSYPSVEVLVTFMHQSIVRFHSHPENEGYLDELFGCPNWRLSTDYVGLYKAQVRKAAGASYVQSFEIRDRNNIIKYHTVFATNRFEGYQAMKDAMYSVDPSGSFRFSAFERDRRQERQLLLFDETEAQVKDLLDRFREEFSSKTVGLDHIVRFTYLSTPYIEKHVRPSLTLGIEDGHRLIVPHYPPSERKPRRGSYPKGTTFTFLG